MVLISKEDSNKQVASLLERYPNLTVTNQTDNRVDIRGKIHINRNCDKISVCKEYGIEISIPLNSDRLPMVRETEHYIRNYPHIYTDRSLCLATDTDLYLHFREGFDLVDWMEKYVELYFVSYECYKRYGVFPFGERSHGSRGVLEFYRDYFNLSTLKQAGDILTYISTREYRGHYSCPCGSGKKLRNCHGEIILNAKQDNYLLTLIKRDLAKKNWRRREKMQGILERQNERKMLEIQFVAKFFFNVAEKTNAWATYLAIIPLLFLLPYPDSWDVIITTIAVVIDISVVALIFVTQWCVNNAADLRTHFDDYVLHATKSKLNTKLKGWVYRIVQFFSKQAEIAMSNTGADTPPGVRKWYGLKSASNYNDAVVKCLNENRWWDEKLNIHRVISTAIFLTVVIVLSVVLVFTIREEWYVVMLAVIQLVLRLGERLVTNIKYHNATERLKGAYDVLDRSHTRANQKSVQEAINARRHIPVLGSNWWHRRRARKLSEEYENTIA